VRRALAAAYRAKLLRTKGGHCRCGIRLSLNRYKEIEHDEVAHKSPAEILAELRRIEAEIATGTARLEELL
jgi:hypothetical protein